MKFAKVMFLRMSVSHSVHGGEGRVWPGACMPGGACVAGGHACLGGVHARGEACVPRTPTPSPPA